MSMNKPTNHYVFINGPLNESLMLVLVKKE